MDKSCPVVVLGNSKKTLECQNASYYTAWCVCVCVCATCVNICSFCALCWHCWMNSNSRFLAVPHQSCGRSSSETNVFDGNQSLWRIWKQCWLCFVTWTSPWTVWVDVYSVRWFDSPEKPRVAVVWTGNAFTRKHEYIYMTIQLFTSEHGCIFFW